MRAKMLLANHNLPHRYPDESLADGGKRYLRHVSRRRERAMWTIEADAELAEEMAAELAELAALEAEGV